MATPRKIVKPLSASVVAAALVVGAIWLAGRPETQGEARGGPDAAHDLEEIAGGDAATVPAQGSPPPAVRDPGPQPPGDSWSFGPTASCANVIEWPRRRQDLSDFLASAEPDDPRMPAARMALDRLSARRSLIYERACLSSEGILWRWPRSEPQQTSAE